MGYNNIKLKITVNGVDLGGKKDSSKKKRGSGLNTFSKYTQPLSHEKQDALLSGGWTKEDVNRMMMAKPKMKIYSDGGYAYI
jgi:hypothetical protein